MGVQLDREAVGGQRLIAHRLSAEQVETGLDGGSEGDDDGRIRRHRRLQRLTVLVVLLKSVQIVNAEALQCVLPRPVKVGGVGDAEELPPQTEGSLELVRTVESQLDPQDVEVGLETTHDVRKPVSNDRLPAVHPAEQALPGQIGQKLAPGLGVASQQVGFVVVRLGCEEHVARRQVELGAVLLQGVVSEDTKGHVLITILADLVGGLLSEGRALFEQPHPSADRGLIEARRLLDGLHLHEDFQLQDRCLPDEVLHHAELLSRRKGSLEPRDGDVGLGLGLGDGLVQSKLGRLANARRRV